MRKKLTAEVVEQYRMVQRKLDSQRSAGLSNEDFLRASNVRVIVETEVEAHLDQVVELLNGTNEINYTKKRIKTEEDLAELRWDVQSFGFHAGRVFVADNYGDYGFIGFFLLRRVAGSKRLIHFTFSCRIMNMGIEQYIYEMLGRPDIDIAGLVTYGLQTHEKIDWINQGSASSSTGIASQRKVVLLGGCDLLQLATYCGGSRQEFVSKIQDGVRVRYDDPGFILNGRENIRNSAVIGGIPFWTYQDAATFDAAITSSDLILISLSPAARGYYFRTSDQLLLHTSKQTYRQIKMKDPDWFKTHAEKLRLSLEDRVKLIVQALDRLSELCSARARIFVLGCCTLGDMDGKLLAPRHAYNAACRDYCGKHDAKFTFIDVDEIVPRDALIDRSHFTPRGYFALAKYIVSVASNVEHSVTLHAA